MLKLFFNALVLTAVALPVAAQDLESDQGKLGYAIGYEFGSETSQWDVDIEAVVTAIRDADAGRNQEQCYGWTAGQHNILSSARTGLPGLLHAACPSPPA